MSLLFVSFIAGVLTVLAPCILPLLPVIIGRSLTQTNDTEKGSQIRRNTPLIVCLSLALSIFIFTFLLKVSTVFIDIPQDFWKYLSAAILVFFGVFGLLGDSWATIMNKIGLAKKSNMLLGSGLQKKSLKGDIIMGAALGPVFSTCSPTYFIILATVLPTNFGTGIVYLLAYIAGLCLVLFGVSVLGQKFVKKLNILANPNGLFKKSISILFIFIGIFIATGADKKLQTTILDAGFFDVTKIEQRLIEQTQKNNDLQSGSVQDEQTTATPEENPPPVRELTKGTKKNITQPCNTKTHLYKKSCSTRNIDTQWFYQYQRQAHHPWPIQR
jgi:cytochrome c-type biogenesis protein